MAFQKVEFEFPHEADEPIEVESSSAMNISEADNSSEESINSEDLEVEVIDDTPEADKNRKPSKPPEDVTEEELEDYSDKVRKRIQHFSKGYHDERRAKEEAVRAQQEYEKLTQQLMEENKKLKTSADRNRTALLEQAKKTAEIEANAAKRAYKEAYESGDSDAVMQAQEQLTTAKIKTDRLANYKLPTLQEEKTPVDVPPEPAPTRQVFDERAAAWQKANPWFNVDDEMTSLALGLHNKLTKQGVSPQSDEYYETIDARMRQVFPENFEDAEPKRKTQVVAPATRSTAPKKVTLTRTQVQIAKRLGLTPEQYAKQVAIDMRKADG